MKLKLEQEINTNYFKKEKDIKKILKENHYTYEFLTENDIPRILIKHNGKLIANAQYKVLGSYNIYNSIWYWSYNIAFLNKQTILKKKYIKKYNKELLNIMGNYEDDVYIEYINYITFNDNFYISLNKLDLVERFGLYLFEKYDWCIKICDNINATCIPNDKNKKIEYILINNIITFE